MKHPRKGRASKTRKDEVERPSVRKSLPVLMFEHSADLAIQEFASKLPPSFTREELARLIDAYLALSVRKIQLADGSRRKINAIDIERVYDPKKDGGLFEQADFRQWAEPLFVDDNFQMLSTMMQSIRSEARELGLRWDVAAPIVSRTAEKLRPDQRSKRIKRGEVSERVIGELKEIRERHTEFRTFEELEQRFPGWVFALGLEQSRASDQHRNTRTRRIVLVGLHCMPLIF